MPSNHPPRIWLEYRPIRIGWMLHSEDISQVKTAARWSACLWGGRFNPMIPVDDRDLADRLIRTFNVDVLIAPIGSAATEACAARHPYLRLHSARRTVFNNGRCNFVDIRHVLSRHRRPQELSVDGVPTSQIRHIVQDEDPLLALFLCLFGDYPASQDMRFDYLTAMHSALKVQDALVHPRALLPLNPNNETAALGLTTLDLTWQRDRSIWKSVGLVVGDSTNFDDLVLLWNLRAAGAEVSFYDPGRSDRFAESANDYLATVRTEAVENGEPTGVSLWSRSPQWPPGSPPSHLELGGVQPVYCRGSDPVIWNGLNIRPAQPRFPGHQDVVPTYSETPHDASASFGLPTLPFNTDDLASTQQTFVVSVGASQFGPAADGPTFHTPWVPQLNEFYGRNFYFQYDKARSGPGNFGRGVVGIFTPIGTQRLDVHAFHPTGWFTAFFELVGIGVERSEPGLRCSRLIRQLGGLQGVRVLKVRGARELIRRFGPDQNFTRSQAEKCIGDFDESSRQMRFKDFEDLYIEPRDSGSLSPNHVLQYLTSRGVFRIGLEFLCPNCQLTSWNYLDDIKTLSICTYCGHIFDVTGQLKDRDWRYRRSGLFGRDDHQLGGIPAALVLQQLDTALEANILFYSTALNFVPKNANIEPCESDFVAVVSTGSESNDARIQLVIGEAKTSMVFDADDVRKLGKLADVIPIELAEVFILFAKTEAFTADEVALAYSLNTRYRHRVILWSQNELEPYYPYERSEHLLGSDVHAISLSEMASVTERLWPVAGAEPTGTEHPSAPKDSND